MISSHDQVVFLFLAVAFISWTKVIFHGPNIETSPQSFKTDKISIFFLLDFH